MIEVYKVSIESISESEKAQIVSASERAGGKIVDRTSMQHVGFHSTPKKGDIGFIVAEDDNITMIASSDLAEDRPDDLENTTTIYRDKDKYVKIDDSGDITVANDNNKIILKSNGDIELGEGSLKALVNEAFKDEYESHVHNFTAAPSGAFSTSTPAKVAGTVPSTPAGGAVATFLSQITSSQLTSKTKAE